MNNDVAALSHTSDIDGIGAASLVRMKFHAPLSNIFFTGYSAAEVAEAEAAIRPLYKKRVLLFITDLVPESKAIPVYERIVDGISKGGGAVIFLDHHPWGGEAVQKVAKKCLIAVFGENRQMCATELTRRCLGMDSKFAISFTRLVHHADFYIQLQEKGLSRLLEQYAMHIGGVNMCRSYGTKMKKLRHMVKVISSGRLIDGEISRGAERFALLNEERIGKMLKNLYIISGKMAVGFSKQVDSTRACMSVIKEAHTSMSVVVNLDHSKASMRSVKPDISRLANAMGGGGHPHAAAFNIDMKRYNFFRTNRDRQRLVEAIAAKARTVGLL